jgi:YesN/AraC family two-component response regulator
MDYLKTLKVLHVDDSRLIRNIVQDLLKDKVKELYFSENGKEGLKSYHKYKPDIILSDIEMPVMDGLSMCEIIKDIDSSQPIILITSLENVQILKKAIELGIDSFLAKPIYKESFFKTINTIVQIIENKNSKKELQNLQVQKEKMDLLLHLIKEISHHWRQPLSSISTMASGNLVKNDAGILTYDDLIKDMENISNNVEKLSALLNKIETIDIQNSNIEDIESLIKISNPIY